MNRNLYDVAVVLIVLLTGVALGMIWGIRVSPWFHATGLEPLAITARAAATVVVFVACGLSFYARTLREAVPMLVGLAVTQLVVSIGYAVVLWLPHTWFLRQPVG